MVAESGCSVSWLRRLWLSAVGVAIVLAACSSGHPLGERVGSTSQALTPAQQRILGFESVGGGSADWTSTSGTLSQSTQHVEGSGSLAISNSGSTTITSAALSSLGPVADRLTLDLLLPAVQPNPWWMGTVKIVIECPSQQLWYEGLAEHQLSGKPTGQFLRFEFPLSESTRQKLSTGSYSDLRFKILLNVETGVGPWLIDRLWVTDAENGGSLGSGGAASGGTAGTTGQGGTSDPTSANAEILGFENPSLWTTSAGSIAASEVRVEGVRAIEVSSISYAEITSAPLTTLASFGPVVGFDLSVPNPEGDVWWWGSVAISLDCPSRGVHERWLGQQQLDGATLGRFRRVEVNLPDDIRTALTTGAYSDLRVKIILTVPQGSGPYVLDRFTFAQQQPEPAPPAPSEALIRAIGFETLEAWRASAATLSLSSQSIEGSSALAVSDFTYTELTSQRLSSLGSQVDSPLTVNVFVPTPPTPHWVGTISLSLDLPSAGIHSQLSSAPRE